MRITNFCNPKLIRLRTIYIQVIIQFIGSTIEWKQTGGTLINVIVGWNPVDYICYISSSKTERVGTIILPCFFVLIVYDSPAISIPRNTKQSQKRRVIRTFDRQKIRKIVRIIAERIFIPFIRSESI